MNIVGSGSLRYGIHHVCHREQSLESPPARLHQTLSQLRATSQSRHVADEQARLSAQAQTSNYVTSVAHGL